MGDDPRLVLTFPPTRYVSLASALVVLLVFLTAGLSTHHLQRDELRVAGIASAMESGASSVAIPRQAGEPFLEKPPLGFACVAASFKLLGRHRVAARLPSVLWSLLGAGFLGLLAWDIYGTRSAALAAGVVLLFTGEYFWASRRCLVDPPLVAGVIAAVALARRAVASPDRRWMWFPLASAAATVAFFSKGAIGLVFPTLAFIGIMAGRRDASCLKSPWPWVSPLLLILAVGGWLFAVHAEGGEDALRVVVVDNHLRRFFPAAGYLGGHQKPFHYYFSRLPPALLPGLLLLPASLWWHAKGRRDRPELREALWICALWLGAGFLVLSLAGTKRVLYLIPLLPPAALLVGGWLGSLFPKRDLTRLEQWTVRGVLATSALAAVSLPVALLAIPTAEHTPLWSVVCPLAVLVVATLAVLTYWGGHRGSSLLLSLVTCVLVAASLMSVVLSAPAREKMPGRFFYETVDRILPSTDYRLDVLGAHEATLGGITYYTGRIPRYEPSLQASRSALQGASSAPYYVLVVDRVYPGVTPQWEVLMAKGVYVRLQTRRGRLISTLLSNVPGLRSSSSRGK